MESLSDIYYSLKTKQIIMIGQGRIALDVQYMFRFPVQKNISIISEDLSKFEENTLFLICIYEEREIIAQLEKVGYKRYENYLTIEDIAKLLDFPFDFFEQKNKILCAAGKNADQICQEFLDYYRVEFDAIDLGDDKVIEKFGNQEKNVYIINNRANNIERYLRSGKYQYNRNLFVISPMGKCVSNFFLEMEKTKPLKMSLCRHPFEFIEIVPSRDRRGISAAVDLCCPMFIKERIGYLREASFQDIWEGRMAQLQRLSVINRSYYFCNRQNCRYLKEEFEKAKELMVDSIISLNDYDIVTPKAPKHVVVDIDQSCNLKCKYCRENIHINSEADKKSLKSVTDKIKNQIIPYCEELMLAGNGEVFASPYYQDILFAEGRKNKQRLQLTTNALLIDREKMLRLLNIYSDIEIWVSIDAACKESYERIRKNGKWEDLLNSLSILKRFREEGMISFLRFNFIVTAKSYLEMPEFIRFAKQYKADSILFQRLEHTSVLSDKEFDELSIFKKDGTLKECYKEFLMNPIFNDPIINKQNNVLIV